MSEVYDYRYNIAYVGGTRLNFLQNTSHSGTNFQGPGFEARPVGPPTLHSFSNQARVSPLASTNAGIDLMVF